MQKRGFLLIVLLIFCGSLHAAYAQSGGVTHIVREGETLSSIAGHYRVSVDAIIAANHLKDPDALSVGQRLIIPTASGSSTSSQPVSQPSAPGTYTVQQGDTLIGIAARFGITVEALMAANKITDPGLVRIGQTLKIPGEQAEETNSGLPSLPDGQYTLNGSPSISVQISGGRLVGVQLQTPSSGKQLLPLSCEAKIAAQLAMMYGLNFDEMSFLARLPHSLNPRRGFVGSINGRFYWPGDIVGNTANGPGGVHVEGWTPLFQALSGFQTRLLGSTPAAAQAQIDLALRHGYPVAVWAILGFRATIAKNSVWIGASADGTAIDCGGPAPNCSYLASGEHAYLILGRNGDSYLVYDPGKGEISYYSRSTVITGITTLFAGATGSAPGAVIIPTANHLPDMRQVPNW